MDPVFLLIWLVVAVVFIVVTLAVIIWMDRHGIWHEKETWLPGPRAKVLQASVDRIEERLVRIEQRLDDLGR